MSVDLKYGVVMKNTLLIRSLRSELAALQANIDKRGCTIDRLERRDAIKRELHKLNPFKTTEFMYGERDEDSLE